MALKTTAGCPRKTVAARLPTRELEPDCQENRLQQKLEEHKALLQEMLEWKGKDKSEMYEHFKDRFPQKFTKRHPHKYIRKNIPSNNMEGAGGGSKLTAIMMRMSKPGIVDLCSKCNSGIIVEHMPREATS